jgi:hypothetical protein
LDEARERIQSRPIAWRNINRAYQEPRAVRRKNIDPTALAPSIEKVKTVSEGNRTTDKETNTATPPKTRLTNKNPARNLHCGTTDMINRATTVTEPSLRDHNEIHTLHITPTHNLTRLEPKATLTVKLEHPKHHKYGKHNEQQW